MGPLEDSEEMSIETMANEYPMPVDKHGDLLFGRSEAIRWYKRFCREAAVRVDRSESEKYLSAAKRIKREYRL
jgi:hypothetical protein